MEFIYIQYCRNITVIEKLYIDVHVTVSLVMGSGTTVGYYPSVPSRDPGVIEGLVPVHAPIGCPVISIFIIQGDGVWGG